MKEFYPDQEQKILIDVARAAREKSYSPYSKFKVGAAILAKDGKIYTGCNIESVSYSPTTCAERVALFKAVSEGNREFVAIAVVGAADNCSLEYCSPCGVCRQMLREFCDTKSFLVMLSQEDYLTRSYSLEELLPDSFGPENLAPTIL